MSKTMSSKELLKTISGSETPTPEQFRELVTRVDSHDVLAKVFLLEGTPHVFKSSPMKYVIFREQVAERFDVGSQDVCIVGSAMLGYSPSPHKYGTPFDKTSDVDVVIISDELCYRGSRALFTVLNQRGPHMHQIRPFLHGTPEPGKSPPIVDLDAWKSFKEATRNFVYENFNPGLLPGDHPLRMDIFSKISSTAGLFLALEPQVFVSKIRCRIFRSWKAAEDYYANTLREARHFFERDVIPDDEVDDTVDIKDVSEGT